MNLPLDDVDLTAVRPDLVTALVVSAAALIHGEMLVRRLVIKRVVPRVILERVFGRRTIERSPHSGAAVRLVDLPMAGGAGFGRDVICRSTEEVGSCRHAGEKERGRASHPP